MRWNDQEITDAVSLSRLVARTKIGSVAKVIIIRQGRSVRVPLGWCRELKLIT